MATSQSTFPTVPAIGVAGMRVNTEPCNIISRTLESAAGLAFGQPAFRGSDDHGAIVGGAFAATGAGSEQAGNTGTATITDVPVVASPAKQGRYRFVQMVAGATGEIVAYDPNGLIVGNGVVGTEFTIDGITATITTGGSPAVGDTYFVDVTYTANAKLLGFNVLDPSVPAVASSPDKSPQYATISIINEGLLWAIAGASVADGDPVYWIPATGKYSNVVGAGNVLMPGVIFDTTAADTELVRLAIRKRIQ